MEVLEHAPKAAHRSMPRWVLIVVAAVILTIVAGFLIDGMQRGRESDALEQAYSESLVVLEAAEASVIGTVAYASPLLQTGPAQVRASLEQVVLDEVTDGIGELDEARAELADATVWPWHAEQVDLKQQLLAQLDERSKRLRGATGQGLAATASISR